MRAINKIYELICATGLDITTLSSILPSLFM
jgi:hypothetical protein